MVSTSANATKRKYVRKPSPKETSTEQPAEAAIEEIMTPNLAQYGIDIQAEQDVANAHRSSDAGICMSSNAAERDSDLDDIRARVRTRMHLAIEKANGTMGISGGSVDMVAMAVDVFMRNIIDGLHPIVSARYGDLPAPRMPHVETSCPRVLLAQMEKRASDQYKKRALEHDNALAISPKKNKPTPLDVEHEKQRANDIAFEQRKAQQQTVHQTNTAMAHIISTGVVKRSAARGLVSSDPPNLLTSSISSTSSSSVLPPTRTMVSEQRRITRRDVAFYMARNPHLSSMFPRLSTH